jgi:hypothetical protein
MLVLVATSTLAASTITAAPAARAASRRAPTPSGLVTRTLSVSMTCSDGGDPPGTGPFDKLLTDLVVQVTAPAVVPFGGTIRYTGFRYSLTLVPSIYGGPATQLYAGPATHVMPEGQFWFGTSLDVTSPGRYTSSPFSSTRGDVRGKVGDVVTLPVWNLASQWTVTVGPYAGSTIIENCTPDPGTPPLATTVIGRPPGGAPASDKVVIIVRDQTTRAIVYHAAAFVTAGDFVVTRGSVGVHIYGIAKFPGVNGGTATFTLLASTKEFLLDGLPIDLTTTVLSLSDPGAGMALNGSGQYPVLGGPWVGSENVNGVVGATLANGHLAAVSWVIRDLA